MKCFVLSILFAVLLVAEAGEKRCRSADDCDEGECCLSRDLFGFRKGDCTKLAQKGEKCNDEARTAIHFKKYFLQCPCAPGLSCEPTETEDHPFFDMTVKINERCVESATTLQPEETEAPTEAE